MKRVAFIVFLILLVDQVLKIWIKTHMYLGESIPVFHNWFFLHFTENEGMAFGLQLAGKWGKLILSILRIIAVVAIGYWIYLLTRKKTPFGLIFSLSLILAGALGNIIDSAFYGLIFSESTYSQMAVFSPPEGGYASFLHGKVVDMFYFPIIHGTYPSWLPWVGSQDFIFFRPVFNIADSSITTGVLLLILFQKRFFRKR